MEIWKNIPDYEGIYQVSDLGNIRSLSRTYIRSNGNPYTSIGKILSPTILNTGYLDIILSNAGKKKHFKIHKLVAISFLGHTNKDGYVVDHKDNNKLNNRLDNLQLISHRENCSKDKKGHTSKYVGVSRKKGRKKWYAHARIEGKETYLGSFDNEEDARKCYLKTINSL